MFDSQIYGKGNLENADLAGLQDMPCYSARMKSFWNACAALLAMAGGCTAAQESFTLQSVLSAPYATSLTASPDGHRFAWVENAEGRHNLWVGGLSETARQLTHYTEDDGQDLSGIAWSPDGTVIAFVRGAENGADGKPANPAHLQYSTPREVWVATVTGSEAPLHVDEGQGPVWFPGGKGLFYVRGGQVWLARFADLSPGTCVIGSGCYLSAGLAGSAHAPATLQAIFDRGSASQLTLSPDGALLAFVSRRDHDHSFVGLFDVQARTLRFMAPSTENDSAPAFSRDGKELAWLRTPFTDAPEFAANRVSANPWSIEVANVASGETHTVFAAAPDKPGSVLPHLATGEPRLFWDAGGRIVFFSEADGWLHLYRIDPAHLKTPQLLTPGEFEVEDVALSADGKMLEYGSNEVGAIDKEAARKLASGSFDRLDSSDTERRHLWSLDLTQAQPVPRQQTHGAGIETHPQLAGNGKTLAALASGARLPMHPVIVAADGRMSALHEDAVPAGYPARQFVTPQQVFFLSSDKLYKLHGQMFLPAGQAAGKHPAILFFHGGPRREMLLGYPGMEYYSNAYAMNQYLVSRGFIVLSVNYRCGIGYGMEFRQCEHSGADGATEYNDVLGTAAYLRSRPDVDPKRIGVWGGSYGGYLTALALARSSDMFAAGVDFHGVHDWILEDNRADWLRGNNAERDAIAARAHASSPMADVGHWRSPVLLIHGDNDPSVAYAQTPVLADALRAHGVHVEELIFPDEVHEFLLHKDWLAAYEAEAAFFERILRPERDPKPVPGP